MIFISFHFSSPLVSPSYLPIYIYFFSHCLYSKIIITLRLIHPNIFFSFSYLILSPHKLYLIEPHIKL